MTVMRNNKTRKGPPPQKNRKLIQAMREVAAAQEAAAAKSAPIQTEVIDIVVDIPREGVSDEDDKS